ncbi:hypothetical protein Sste5346_010029 [Sporothrix stenoceras]|uniref:Magnesium chelatase n=1 Tax=Sporothrix stenoceras TaxID=5173 RepID=A0ABR3YHB8_9PEZI
MATKGGDAGGLGRNSYSYSNGTSRHRLNGSSTANYFQLSSTAPQPSGLSGARTARQMTGGGLTASATSPSTVTPTAIPPAGPSLVANVVVAKNLNMAPEAVQIQTLELLRTRRIFTATAMQAAPRPFLLVAVVAAERGFRWDGADDFTREPTDPKIGQKTAQKGARPKSAPHMTAYLNDFFSMGHWHDPEDGYPNIEDRGPYAEEEWRGEGTTDSESVVRWQGGSTRTWRRRSTAASASSLGTVTGRSDGPDTPPTFSEADIDHIAALSRAVRVDMEVLRYQLNVVAFLRMHRAVAVMGPAMGGASCVSPRATKHLEKLAQCLAPLHRLDYISPSLVALAARKTYLHRIRTVPVGHSGSCQSTVHERSMQWGSEKVAVEAILEGMSPEEVIDDVLGTVVPPV